MFHSSLYWPHPHVPTGKPTSKPIFIVHANIKSFDQPWNDQYPSKTRTVKSLNFREIWEDVKRGCQHTTQQMDTSGKATGHPRKKQWTFSSSLRACLVRRRWRWFFTWTSRASEKIAVEHWQMHLFASPGHGPVTMLESSRNQTTSSCWHSACTLVHPRPAPSGVPTTAPATSPSTSAVPTAWHPA